MRTKRDIYICSHPGCKEENWLGKGFDWKMCEVVFGVHPKVYKAMAEPVAVIQEKFNFCGIHAPIYKDALQSFLAEAGEVIVLDGALKEGLGCWVTIHDCLTHEPIQNFQMSYQGFERVRRLFYTCRTGIRGCC